MDKACLVLWIALLLTPFQLFGQRISRTQTDKTAKRLKIADQLFEQGKYYAAANYYGKIIVEVDSPYIAYQLAQANRYGRFYEYAALWYEDVAGHKKYPLARYWLGMMQKTNENYDKARSSFQKFVEEYTENDYYKERAKKEIQVCDSVQKLREHPVSYSVSHFKENINTSRSDFGAVEPQSNAFYYTSTVDKKIYGLTLFGWHIGGSDTVAVNRLFKVPRQDSFYYYSERTPLHIPLKEEEVNIGSPTFSADQKKLYFSICKGKYADQECKIYVTQKEEGTWSTPSPLPAPVNTKHSSNKNPMIIPYKNKSDVLLFASDRETGEGGYDIWYTRTSEHKGKEFSPPHNLGSTINSRNDEITPFYYKRQHRLYFSSNGYLSMGGYDVFSAKGSIDSAWQSPENVGYPINGGTDDYYFTKYYSDEKEQAYGFLSSNRKTGYKLNQQVSQSSSEDREGNAKKLSTCCDDVYYYRKEKTNDSLLVLTGALTDTASQSLDSVIISVNDQYGLEIYSDTAASKYVFELDFSRYKRFNITFSKKGYKDTAFSLTQQQFGTIRDSLHKAGQNSPYQLKRNIQLQSMTEAMVVRQEKFENTFLDSVIKAKQEQEDSTLGEKAYEIMLSQYGKDTLADLHYKVQVGAYEHPGPQLLTQLLFSLNVQKVSELETEETDFGVTRFLVGKDYDNLKEADHIRKKIIKEGAQQEDIIIKDSFVAPYYKGERIKMFTALKLLREKEK